MNKEQVRFLDAREVAEMLHVSLATVNRMQSDKEIPEADYLIAGQKKRLWKFETIMNHLENNCKNPRKEHMIEK